MAPKRNLGTRHGCLSCGTKFYDLNRPEPRCPKCGTPSSDDSGLSCFLAAVPDAGSEAASRARVPSSEPDEVAGEEADTYFLDDDEYPLNMDKELDAEFTYNQES